MTVLWTFPLAFRLDDFLFDIPAGDHGMNVWNLWWVGHWATTPDVHLFETDYMFHPVGADLTFHTMSPLNCFLSLPLQVFVSPNTAYNVILLLSFFLSGVGMYLLAREWKGGKMASFLVGLWFAFSHYRFGHLVHTNLLSTQRLPLFLWALSRFLKNGRLLDAAMAGLTLCAAGLSCLYYLVFACLAGALLTGYRVYKLRRNLNYRKLILGLVFATLIFSIPISPYLFRILTSARPGEYLEYSYEVSVFYSADLLAYLIPESIASQLKAHLNPYAFSAETPDSIFPNWTLIVALFGIVVWRKRLKEPLAWEWIVLAAAAMLLSLGPLLKCGGIVRFGEWILIPTPVYFLKNFSLFTQIRVFDRFSLLVHLALMVFVARHIQDMIAFAGKTLQISPKALWGVIILLGCFQNWHGPLTISQKAPLHFFENIGSENEDYSIIEVPILQDTYPGEGRAMFHQTIHGKKMVNGHVSRPSLKQLEALEAIPLLHILKNCGQSEVTDKFGETSEVFLEQARSMRLRYIILHSNLLNKETYNRLRSFLVTTLGYSLTFSDVNMEVYQRQD